MVEVVPSKFGSAEIEAPAFYEQPWFMGLVRYGAMLLAVLLVLLLAVRPWLARLREKDKAAAAPVAALAAEDSERFATLDDGAGATAQSGTAQSLAAAPDTDLPQALSLARQFAASQPDRAALALQRMLQAPVDPVPATAAGVTP
jgi:flagellar M-ring protein FliF